jgi:hypothetical protein
LLVSKYSLEGCPQGQPLISQEMLDERTTRITGSSLLQMIVDVKSSCCQSTEELHLISRIFLGLIA